jgi:hypothetical protein
MTPRERTRFLLILAAGYLAMIVVLQLGLPYISRYFG